MAMPDALDKAIGKLRDLPTRKRRAAAAAATAIEDFIATATKSVR